MKPNKVYLTIKKFCEEYRSTGWVTYDSLRYIIRNENTNGFKNAIVRIGKRILIDTNEFWDIVEQKKGDK